MGFGGDCIEDTANVSYKTFMALQKAACIEDITEYDPHSKRKYNYRYITAGDYYPCAYTICSFFHIQTPGKTNVAAKSLRTR